MSAAWNQDGAAVRLLRFGVPACRVTLATWMLRCGQAASAVALLGHVQQAVDALGATLHPDKQAEVDSVLRQAEAESGATAVQIWLEQGRVLNDGAMRALVVVAVEASPPG